MCDLSAPKAAWSVFELGSRQVTLQSATFTVMCFLRALEASISRRSHHEARTVAATGWPFTSWPNCGRAATCSSGSPPACFELPMPRHSCPISLSQLVAPWEALCDVAILGCVQVELRGTVSSNFQSPHDRVNHGRVQVERIAPSCSFCLDASGPFDVSAEASSASTCRHRCGSCAAFKAASAEPRPYGFGSPGPGSRCTALHRVWLSRRPQTYLCRCRP